MNVFVDNRWPQGTGIGRMMDLYRAEAGRGVILRDLDLAVKIGSPLSPFALTAALRRAAPQSANSVFWNPGFIPPVSARMKSVVTVHDLTHLHHYTPAHRLYYNTVFRPLYRRCERIVCVSEYTRNEFLEWSGMPEARVIVVPNAISPGFADLSPPLRASSPFLFYAGNRRPFKNVPLLVRAFAASGLATEGVRLVLTGDPDRELQDIARSSDIEKALEFTGFLDDAAVVAHYKAATGLVFISRYEGFGLPILEAFQCGTPVLLSNASSFPEVAGDAALYVETDNLEQTAHAMRVLCTQERVRADLIERGRKRLALFDVSVSAAKLWHAIGEVAAS